MKKTIYYTVDYRNIENGFRDVSVYYIENNIPTLWFELHDIKCNGGSFYSDEEEIQEYLDDNGYGEYEIVML